MFNFNEILTSTSRLACPELPLVAISGMGRGESPQPGPAVLTSLQRRWPTLRAAGLVYDALESGIYSANGPEAAFTLPYPSCGAKTVLERIDAIRERFPFTVLIPTLDVEIEPLMSLQGQLAQRRISVMVPEPRSFKARSKINLTALANQAGVLTPRTVMVNTATEAAEAAFQLGGTVMIKGPFYDARPADAPSQAAHHAAKLLAEWGGPLLVQERLQGEEFCLLMVGDGKGNSLGSCGIRKMVVSSRGKGYAGITVQDNKLNQAGEALLRELNWRGPCECEFIRTKSGGYHLIEINPRFPAWADFPSALGVNLAAAAFEQTLGWKVNSVPSAPAGKVFLRHSVDIVCDAAEFSKLAMEGQILRLSASH